MVEIEECRSCGNCCYYWLEIDGCLFLDFNKQNSQFSCLIYRNSAKSRIDTSSLNGLLSQDPREYQKSFEYFSKSLSFITTVTDKNHTSACYNHECRSIMLYGKISVDIRTSDEHREAAVLFQEKVEKIRKHVPNFADLVERLNKKQE